jgi:hypothetical protein
MDCTKYLEISNASKEQALGDFRVWDANLVRNSLREGATYFTELKKTDHRVCIPPIVQLALLRPYLNSNDATCKKPVLSGVLMMYGKYTMLTNFFPGDGLDFAILNQ